MPFEVTKIAFATLEQTSTLVQISCQKCEIKAETSHYITLKYFVGITILVEQANSLNGENCCDQVFGHAARTVEEGGNGRLQCWLRE